MNTKKAANDTDTQGEEHALSDNETDILNEIFRLIRLLPDGPVRHALNKRCVTASEQVIRKIFERTPN